MQLSLLLVAAVLLATPQAGRPQTHAGLSFNETAHVALVAPDTVHVRCVFAAAETTSSGSVHHRLLPAGLDSVLARHGAQRVELALTQGTWQQQRWRLPPGALLAPPGAELLAEWPSTGTAEEDTDAARLAQWQGLAGDLAGLTSTALTALNTSQVARPQLARLQPPPQRAVRSGGPADLWYGQLPRETLCAENFRPWRQLLPGKNAAGLSALASASRLRQALYLSLRLEMERECHAEICSLRVTHTLSYVTRLPKPRPLTLATLLQVPRLEPCVLAARSTLVVAVDGAETEQPLSGDADLTELLVAKALADAPPRLPQVQRLTPLQGLDAGAVVTRIVNPDPVREHRVAWLQITPWYLRTMAHTLRVTRRPLPSSTGPEGAVSGAAPVAVEPTETRFQPARDYGRPAVLEAVLRLPPLSETTIAFHVQPAFMRREAYPADPNRGLDMPAAVLTVLPTGERLYSAPEAVRLPLPDFSMPFNVVILTMVVMWLTFHTLARPALRSLAEQRPSFLRTALAWMRPGS